MVISTILFPVIAFGLVVTVGRIGTIIMDDMRQDMDTRYELESETHTGSVA